MTVVVKFEVIETRRLVLRPFALTDAERLTVLLQDSEIHRWTSSLPFPYTIDHAHEFLSQRAGDDGTGDSLVWAITLRETGEVIGAMGLHDIQRERGIGELGYWLGADYRGNGYSTEAARRIISWCFEVAGLYRIQATHLPGNAPSAAVMRNIGMLQEGLLRGFGWKNGEHHDLYLWAVLRDDPTWMSSADQLRTLA